MSKILVTPRSVTSAGGHPALERLRCAGYEVILSPAGLLPSTIQLKELLSGCVGYLAGVEKISAEVLRAAGQLRVISRNGVGVNSIDLKAASERGIAVCQAGGANARGVAELTMGLLLALVRHLHSSNAAIKNGAWDRRKGYELKDRCLGLVGCGNVGRLVARFAVCLDMDVLAYDPYQDGSFSIGERFRWVDFDYLLSRADVISLHCPHNPDGAPLIDASALSRMKSSVLILNTARYELLDPDAVLAALGTGHMAGLGLDVFEEEPPIGNLLVHHPHVFATPHIGGYTEESIDRAIHVAVDNLLSQLVEVRHTSRVEDVCEQP